MLVTDIRRIDDKRYCLYIDYEPYASVYSSDIRRLGAEPGADIDRGDLEDFRREYLYKRAMNKAVGSIKFSDKCEHDIRQKLRELYYDDEIIDTTVEKLISYGYIDDFRYACGYIRRHASRKSMSIVRRELDAKHIDGAVIEEAELECQLPDECDTIRRILDRRYTTDELTDKREKVLSYMYSKGFNTKKVLSCMKDILAHEEEIQGPQC